MEEIKVKTVKENINIEKKKRSKNIKRAKIK